MLDLNWNKIDYRGDITGKRIANNFPTEIGKNYFILSLNGIHLTVAHINDNGYWEIDTQDTAPWFMPFYWAEIPKFNLPDELLIRNIN
tara:strand:- start:1066 stop:1329 length:264 start_codon:yes stop_codon:yes gene_type:complete